MSKEDLRFECLKLAATTLGLSYGETVMAAEAYLNFVEKQGDGNYAAVAKSRNREAAAKSRKDPTS